MADLSGTRTLVVGASRGLGRGITTAFARAGADVVAVARSPEPLGELATIHQNVHTEVADAADERTASRLIAQYEPHVLILVAGAPPVMRELARQTWETFSVNWEADVKISFTWLREALRRPLRPGGKVIVFSSGAALNGSPLSGGYAGSKATQRFIAEYAQQESERVGLGIRVSTVLPRMTPFGEVGRQGILAYAAQNGQSEGQFVRQLAPVATPESTGAAVLALVREDAESVAPAYLLTGDGLVPLP